MGAREIAQRAIGRVGRYFFRIMGTAESSGIQNKSTQLVEAFGTLSEEKSEKAKGYQILNEVLRIDPSQIIFQSNNVFQFDFAREFWFGTPDSTGTLRMFIHEAPSPEKSQSLFERLVEEQGYDFELKEQDKNSALLWHDYLKTWFGIGWQGPFVFGVENGPDRDTVTAGLKRMKKGLNGEE